MILMETGTQHLETPTASPYGIDTLAWSKYLTDGGVPKQQAETLVNFVANAVGQSAATKADLSNAKNELQIELALVKKDLQVEIAKVNKDLQVEIAHVKNDILRWVFGMFIAQAGIIIAAIKIF